MRAESSLEAREIVAARCLAIDADETRARAVDAAPSEHAIPFPDASSMAQNALRSQQDDPWRAALFADAHVAAARRRVWRSLHDAVIRSPVTLRVDGTSLRLDALEGSLITEPNAARREALVAAAAEVATTRRGDARAVIDAIRTALDALDPTLVKALAIGEDAHDDLLAATDDLFGDLDARQCRAHEIDRARLTWADRLRTLQGPATLTAIPSATWSSLGARMFDRLGIDDALRGLVDDLRPAGNAARGIFSLIEAPGQRAIVAGRASLSVYGTAGVMGAVTLAAASVTARGPFAGVRRGCDRVVDGVAHALGRRLLGERLFLQREAGIDAAPRERVMLEVAHAELARLRFDVARSRFTAHVLARGPEAAARFHDELMRAWGASPGPAWAPWAAAWMFETGGFWGGRASAMALGARVEPKVVETLRARFDEDWFRNPKAGRGLVEIFDEMRAVGVRAWCDARGGAIPASSSVARLGEVLREARRNP